MHYFGAALVFGIIIAVGAWSGRKVKTHDDYTGRARRANPALVAGALLGTITGGAATIGTAQLAYSNGLSAWWFTIGCAVGLLLFGTVLLRPVYNCGVQTVPGLIGGAFGTRAAKTGAILSSIGTFLSVVAQLLAATALITAFSDLSDLPALTLMIVLVIGYVVFGGSLGAGYVGIVKTVLLLLTVATCALLALSDVGGFNGLLHNPALPPEQYLNFNSRGFGLDAGAGISLVLGVVTEQAYFQTLLSARSVKASRVGTLSAGALVPIIGALGVLVGMSMRVSHPGIESRLALPLFIKDHLPALPAGVALAVLLVVLVGSASGLSFGIATVLVRDLLPQRMSANNTQTALTVTPTDARQLLISRAVLLVVLLGAAAVCLFNMGGLILSWSFLSMGLRGAVAFWPVIAALFLPFRVNPRVVVPAMIAAPAATVLGSWLSSARIDPVWFGVAASFVIMLSGMLLHKPLKKSADS
ncbi:MAG: sodium:solute symporter family protein [Propionibacteriaceae bacterium]|jgi:SSS family solute:Na+ symporter|nr:sodium:solute symporter family protein [Propionibacteriaceae bacterium]